MVHIASVGFTTLLFPVSVYHRRGEEHQWATCPRLTLPQATQHYNKYGSKYWCVCVSLCPFCRRGEVGGRREAELRLLLLVIALYSLRGSNKVATSSGHKFTLLIRYNFGLCCWGGGGVVGGWGCGYGRLIKGCVRVCTRNGLNGGSNYQCCSLYSVAQTKEGSPYSLDTQCVPSVQHCRSQCEGQFKRCNLCRQSRDIETRLEVSLE